MADLPILRVKRSQTASAVPSLTDGEIAINLADKVLYAGDSSNSTVAIANFSGELAEYKLLDNISSSFNGTLTQFTLSSASVNFLNSEIDSEARLIVSVGGVIQKPDPAQGSGFYLSGGTDLSTDPIKINFVEAPKTGLDFFGIAFGLSTSPSVSSVTKEQSIAYSIVFGV
jgi:hypothetical protein